jgi:hypothetical protein
MGERLLMYYKYIGEKQGLDGKRQLAFATGLPSIIAATEPDTREKLEAFKKAVEEITQTPAPEF